MTRKSSRKTQRSRKPAKRSRKPAKRSRKPVKRSRKPVKRSRKPVKRNRKPVKRSRKPVKRSRKSVKFKMPWLRDLARKSVLRSPLKSPRKSVLESLKSLRSPLKPPRQRVKPRAQWGKIINENLIMDNLSSWYVDTRVPHWLLKLSRTHPSQPVLSDEITKNLLVQMINNSPMAKEYLKDHYKNKYLRKW